MSLKEFIYFNIKKIILVVLIIASGSIYLFYLYSTDKNEEVDSKEKVIVKKEEILEEVITMCFFDIKGEVVSPGVYSIECDKRVIDAINISGGLTKNSDTSVLNLSKKIEDGMVIVVYSKKEVSNYLKTLEEETKKNSICSSSNVVNSACISNNSNSINGLININTASLEELMTLSGIGESKAKNIISYRTNNPFKSIEDLLNVDGIGESIYVKIKENITV